MTTAQKIIKNLALVFAAFIIINIISGIIIGISIFSGILGLTQKEQEQNLAVEEILNIINDKEIKTLDIEVKYSELEIKEGDTFKVESNSKDVKCNQNNSRIDIKEKSHNWVSSRKRSKVVIYIPNDIIFDKLNIVAGARRN